MKKIAYFTMEIAPSKISMDGKDFRTYSGGLGVLAGDYFKQATDELRPITFLSILWKNGYSKQTFNNGDILDIQNPNYNWQEYVTDTGIITKACVEGRDVLLKIWKYNDGELFLLDADLECNEEYRYLTYNLYGGNEHFQGQKEKERICQEIILGVGGVNALKSLEKQVDLYHFNDGHAVFAVHKLIQIEKSYGHDFWSALQIVKEKVRFTTHTNVPSGNEKHSISDLINYQANCNLSYDELVVLGGNPYGMTVAALHSCKKVNAVAKIHAISANELWKNIDNISPIFPITNGIHIPTWQKQNIKKAYESEDLNLLIKSHDENKEALINFVYAKNGVKLNPQSLIIGFARRATDYKRWDLFAKIPEALDFVISVFNVQFIFAGKCHKDDKVGRGYIQTICNLSKKYPKNIIFIEGYDIAVASILESGSDIWLNTPNGLEASGTSGMKAGINGCINFSTPDGWWKEAENHGVNGYTIYLHDIENIESRDFHDCQSLMYYLYNEIIPTYTNDKQKWAKIMNESIKTVDEYFSTKRMMEEYFQLLYI